MAEPSAAVVDLTKLHESDDGADDEISSIISSTAKARALVDLLLDLSLGSYVMHNFAELICRNTASVYIQYDMRGTFLLMYRIPVYVVRCMRTLCRFTSWFMGADGVDARCIH